MEARCQCGLFHFTIPAEKPIAIAVCHCNKCKITTGSAFMISAVFPNFEFLPSDSQTNIGNYSEKSDSGNIINGYFCKGCGNRMVHTLRGGNEWVTVSAPRITNFDWKLMEDKELVLHCWTKNAVVPIPKGVKTFEEGTASGLSTAFEESRSK